jgi:hypothetical protein
MKKTLFSFLFATGTVLNMFSQSVPGPVIATYYTPNASGIASWVPPSSIQQGRQVASANIVVTANGTTFTPAQLAAINYAKSIWEQAVTSVVPITIDIKFAAMGNTLGLTQPAVTPANFTVGGTEPALISGSYYPKSLANKLHHSELDATHKDMTITICSNPPYPWYYGTDGNCPIGKIDFVTNLLHEIGHGLGFFSSVQYNAGAPPVTYGLGHNGSPKMVLDNFIANTSGTLLSTLASPSTNLDNFCTSAGGLNVVFNGNNAQAQNGNVMPKISAPNPFVNGGSINHWDKATYPMGNVNTLMTPSKSNGEAVHNIGNFTLGLLQDIGWSVQYVVGFEDKLNITSCPLMLSENQAFSCSGSFTDEAPYGGAVNTPYWKVEAFYAGGKVTLVTGTGYYGFNYVNLGTLPAGYDWMREWSNGAVRADVVFYGIDNQGYYHEERSRVGINYRPATPYVAVTSVATCTRTVTYSFYGSGGTSYRLLYAKTPGVTETTPGVTILNPAGNVNSATVVLPVNGSYYFAVRALNNGGTSVLGNEISAAVNSLDASCAVQVPCCGQRSLITTNSENSSQNGGISLGTVSQNNYIVLFQGEGESDRLIQIFNSVGQLVRTEKADKLDLSTPLNLDNLNTGIYLINILSDKEGAFQKKVVVAH